MAAADERNARIHFDVGESDTSVELTLVSLRSLSDGLLIEPDLAPIQISKSQAGKELLERAPVLGGVQLGTLRRVTPISRNWGFDRGLPVDRYYIENFLARYANDIREHVLEIGDNSYTREFGGSHVTRSDVLHVIEGNPQATIVADLTCAPQIPSSSFGLHYPHADTAAHLRCASGNSDALPHTEAGWDPFLQPFLESAKPAIVSGVITGIGISLSCQRGGCLRRSFRQQYLRVEAFGNVLAATSFLHGLAVEE